MGQAILNGGKPSKVLIGLGNVEDKSSEMIRKELTAGNVIDALGYTPVKQDDIEVLSITTDGDTIVLTYADNTTERMTLNGNELLVQHYDGTSEKIVQDENENYIVTKMDKNGNVVKTTTITINGENISIQTS